MAVNESTCTHPLCSCAGLCRFPGADQHWRTVSDVQTVAIVLRPCRPPCERDRRLAGGRTQAACLLNMCVLVETLTVL